MTIAKYQDMTALAGRLNEVSQRLNEKCKFIHSFNFVFLSPVLQTIMYIVSISILQAFSLSFPASFSDNNDLELLVYHDC